MSRHSESATSSRGLTGLRQPRLVILSPPLITVRINRGREPLAPWALIAFAYCDILAQHRQFIRLFGLIPTDGTDLGLDRRTAESHECQS
jgi:hypothetical protein